MKPTWEWIIYYGDGTHFSNENGTPFDAPRRDVQIIVQADDRVGYTIVSAGDYFYWEPELGGWRPSNGFGFYDHLLRCKTPLVLFGRCMKDKDYFDLFMKIKAELGDKQGWLMSERKPSDGSP